MDMDNTHTHTPAERDAERARLASYYLAREAASLPCACPVCIAGPGEPCLPAALTSPHAARERAYGDRLRRDTPDYPDPVPAARESSPDTLRAAREWQVASPPEHGWTMTGETGEAQPVVGVIGLVVMAGALIPHAWTYLLGIVVLAAVILGCLRVMGLAVSVARKIER